MPVCGILNGYYRSGTTILWWIFQLSNLEDVWIYEPHSPAVHGELKKATFWTINRLHNLPIYFPYFVVRDDIRNEYLAKAKPRSIYDSPGDAIATVEMFDKAQRRVYIQPNQLHYVLKSVAEHFDCPFVHVVRDPAETFWSHLPKELRSEKALAEIAEGKHYDRLKGSFWIHDCYEVARKVCKIEVSKKNVLEEFAVSWFCANYVAYKQCGDDRGLFLRFEDFVVEPDETFRKAAKHLGCNVVEAYTRLLNVSRAFSAPASLSSKLMRVFEEYGLTKTVKKFGYDYG